MSLKDNALEDDALEDDALEDDALEDDVVAGADRRRRRAIDAAIGAWLIEQAGQAASGTDPDDLDDPAEGPGGSEAFGTFADLLTTRMAPT
jgi:hypothetical protein